MAGINKKKQKIKNEEWIKMLQKIGQVISREELDRIVFSTIKDIKKKTMDKKAAYAWSGGKDSVVLGKICHIAGITDCVLVICNLEYRAFMEWIRIHKPQGLSVINTGQDMEWLSANPHMLFPQDSRTAARWFNIVQHRGQALYYKNEHLDMIILGRRLADGNYVGNGSNIYTDRHGVTRYSPLSGWTNEQVLAFIYYYGLELPPIYKWKNGYLCGTHPWPARQWTGNIKNAWSEVYSIDSSIVHYAARYFKSAETFLQKHF
ncbi:MAG: hypothetical protein OSJ56_09820 [Prevotella sp.]|nr:hypothetical protein [Prevotella sp.]